MNVVEALNARYSARGYKEDPVSRETLEKVMEAGLRSPSWANTQPWEIYIAAGEPLQRLRAAFKERIDQSVASNPDIPRPTEWPESIRQRMQGPRPAPAAPGGGDAPRPPMIQPRAPLFGAPVIIYLCMDRSLTPYSVYDMGLLSQSIMLAAKEYGLDTVAAVSLVAYPDVLRKELGVPDELEFVLGLALGYASEEAAARPRSTRRSIADAVHFKGI